MPSDDISSLYVDRDGVLWVGTFGNGLVRFEAGKWSYYTTREGLGSNAIGYTIEDDFGYLWIGSNSGLMRVTKKALHDVAHGLTNTLACRVYGKADGMPTEECTQGSQPAASKTSDGKLWFPSIRGLVSVDPAQLKPNAYPPPVVIESVSVGDRLRVSNDLHARASSVLVVPPGQSRVEIGYTSLNLAAAERSQFRYRLVGFDTDWNNVGSSRVALYGKLAPGQYRFEVTVCNEDGLWNENARTLEIVVEPPFWRTWWFLSASIAMFLAAVVAVVHRASTLKLQRQVERLRHQEALEKDRKRIARDLHDQLGATLTQVSLLGELVESDKHLPDEVEAHGRQISQAARETTGVLDEIVWAVNPSNDTLDGLITYICKYAQDYLAIAGIRYRVEAPTVLPAHPISPEVRHNLFLATKEAVTNVVRHAGASELRLRFRLEPRQLTIEIEDNGRGIANAEEPTTRSGLKNMRRRLEEVGGSFNIQAVPNGGTLVRLVVPISR